MLISKYGFFTVSLTHNFESSSPFFFIALSLFWHVFDYFLILFSLNPNWNSFHVLIQWSTSQLLEYHRIHQPKDGSIARRVLPTITHNNFSSDRISLVKFQLCVHFSAFFKSFFKKYNSTSCSSKKYDFHEEKKHNRDDETVSRT